MKRNHYSRKTGALLLIAVMLFFTSCNSGKLTSDYPNIYSDHQQKSEFRYDKRHKTGHTRIAFKDLTKNDLSPVLNSESVTTSEEKAAMRVKSIGVKNDIRLLTMRSVLPVSDYNQGTLTASLSDEPYSPVHRFRPDTTIKTTSAAINTATNE